MRTRADPGAYDRYLRGMDASMRQKVALTAAHFLAEGKVADMGCGSGACSAALAALYPRLEVVGVDADPEMVERARAVHLGPSGGPNQGPSGGPNLDFVAGDVAQPVFPPQSLDGIFDSSVLHHVTSFRGYRQANASEALAVQAAQLRPHGVLVVRDFLAPGDGMVLLEVRTDDGDESDDVSRCSSARLVERFAREFRSLHERPGCPCERLQGAPPGWARFRLSWRHAVELALRKDYRQDWEAEIREEYTYFTQAEFERCFCALGLRVLASAPLRNPSIVRHRFLGKLALRDLEGRALPPPPTNYVIAGERVPAGEGVTCREAEAAAPLGFLAVEPHRDVRDGSVKDLVRRPNVTVDVLPWFFDGDLYVVARVSYPRPILASRRATPSLDGSRSAPYVTEPLNVLQTDRPLGQTVEALLRGCGIAGPRGFRRGATHYPSPGGTQEEVCTVLVEIDPLYVHTPLADLSGFSTSGRAQAVEAGQVLRAAQVGGLPDARLELMVYDLHARLGRPVGPWIGDAVVLPDRSEAPRVVTPEALAARPPRRAFAPAAAPAGFLQLTAAVFEELDAGGTALRRKTLEYVVPGPFGTNTAAAAVLWRCGGEVLLGVDDADLPAAQAFTGNSELLVAPAWRLPREADTLDAAKELLRERLRHEHGVDAGEIFELGGSYHPSPGVSPERVTPFAVEVQGAQPASRDLTWVPLAPLLRRPDLLADGHLRIVAWRAAHALGLLERVSG